MSIVEGISSSIEVDIIAKEQVFSQAPASSVQQFHVSEFYDCRDNAPTERIHTWESFRQEFSEHPTRLSKDGPAWSPARYPLGKTRGNGNVDSIHFAVIDVDDGTSPEELRSKFANYTYLLHSSYSHTSEKPKYRIILPLARPVPANEWREMWERINRLADGHNDPSVTISR